MTDVLLFHHAQGLTAGIRSFADELRAAGHTVHVPDFYGGRTYATLNEGMAYAEEVGFEKILERNVRNADELPTDLVYAGFSLGEMAAQKLAQTRPGARGALLFSSCIPTTGDCEHHPPCRSSERVGCRASRKPAPPVRPDAGSLGADPRWPRFGGRVAWLAPHSVVSLPPKPPKGYCWPVPQLGLKTDQVTKQLD